MEGRTGRGADETRNSKLPFSIGNLRIRVAGSSFSPGLSHMRFSHGARHFFGTFLPVLLILLPFHAALRAQQRPAEVTLTQSISVPYRYSGRLTVSFGNNNYFGTATFIRRFTGLTAGHLLYDPSAGLGTDLYYEADLYGTADDTRNTVSYFAVLSGYQSAANADPNSDPAFDYDMGYLLFARAEFKEEWAPFGAAPDVLTTESNFLVFGYAAETFTGDKMAFVNIAAPYYELRAPGLFENTSYYTQEGMSGGPLYASVDGVMEVVAETVAGTSPPDDALSDVRAITPAEATMFTEAEYVRGLISYGKITGPTSVVAGGKGKYMTDVVFKDGLSSGGPIPRYDELLLKAIGAHKKLVTITKLKTGKFKVDFSSSLPSGAQVTLALLRGSVAKSEQQPLKTLTVTVQ